MSSDPPLPISNSNSSVDMGITNTNPSINSDDSDSETESIINDWTNTLESDPESEPETEPTLETTGPKPGQVFIFGQDNNVPPVPTGLVSRRSNLQTGADKYHCIQYCWTLDEFSKYLAREPNLMIFSPNFDGDGISKYKWSLSVKPKYTASSENWISINLHLIRGNSAFQSYHQNPFLEATYEISLEINGKLIEFKETRMFDFQVGHGWNKFVKTPTQILNDKITIHVKVWLGCAHIKLDNLKSKFEPGQNLGKFQTDFESLMKSGKFSDARIEVGSEVFRVHKSILACKSDHFLEYFEASTDSDSVKIKVQDFSKEIVASMIEHIYTGRTNIIENNVKELYQIGTKYGLEDLKNDCENVLLKLIKTDNCIKILTFSNTEGASLVKSKCIDCIIKNRHEVSSLPEFQELFDDHSLCTEIFKSDYVGLGGVKRLKIFHSSS